MKNTNFNRRNFLKSLGIYAVAFSATGCRNIFTNPILKKDKPNIIFIMADDLGYADLGCYGQELTKTPYIDRMAEQGTRFTQCYAGGSVCAPSRSVLMTGQHLGHTRVRDNHCRVGGVPDEETGGGCRPPLLLRDITVAEVLQKAGYATGITGKWGLGDPGTTGVPTRQGFDEWFGYLNQNHAVYYYTDYLWRGRERIKIKANKNGKRKKYTHDLFTDFALDFIRRHRNHPFFLYVPYTIPHFKLEVPSTEPYSDKPWPEKAKIFAAMITRMDRDVGRILKLLKELRLDENTIVFFTSDNGGAGNGGPMFNSNGKLKGGKGSFHEGGIRVPMIVRWPGKTRAGAVNNSPWYFADVLPSLAEIARTRLPENIDGISVLPAFLGKNQNNLNNRFMYWESPPPNLRQIVRWQNFKGLRRKPDAPLELYNLAEDPIEENNIASGHPEIVDMFEEYLRTARTNSPYWPERKED